MDPYPPNVPVMRGGVPVEPGRPVVPPAAAGPPAAAPAVVPLVAYVVPLSQGDLIRAQLGAGITVLAGSPEVAAPANLAAWTAEAGRVNATITPFITSPYSALRDNLVQAITASGAQVVHFHTGYAYELWGDGQDLPTRDTLALPAGVALDYYE